MVICNPLLDRLLFLCLLSQRNTDRIWSLGTFRMAPGDSSPASVTRQRFRSILSSSIGSSSLSWNIEKYNRASYLGSSASMYVSGLMAASHDSGQSRACMSLLQDCTGVEGRLIAILISRPPLAASGKDAPDVSWLILTNCSSEYFVSQQVRTIEKISAPS